MYKHGVQIIVWLLEWMTVWGSIGVNMKRSPPRVMG